METGETSDQTPVSEGSEARSDPGGQLGSKPAGPKSRVDRWPNFGTLLSQFHQGIDAIRELIDAISPRVEELDAGLFRDRKLIRSLNKETFGKIGPFLQDAFKAAAAGVAAADRTISIDITQADLKTSF